MAFPRLLHRAQGRHRPRVEGHRWRGSAASIRHPLQAELEISELLKRSSLAQQ